MIRYARVRTFAVSTLLLTAVASAACDDGASTDPGTPDCAPGEFRLEGELAGMTVARIEQSAGGGFSQDDKGGELGTVNNVPGDVPRDRTDLRLAWKRGFDVGGGADVTGTVVFPAGSPRAGETICIGKGSRINDPNGEAMTFRLTGLSTGQGCETALPGVLRGCWR